MGGREAPGGVVEANGGQKESKCYVKGDFGGGNGAALEIRKAWWGRRRQVNRGVRRLGRKRWVLGC